MGDPIFNITGNENLEPGGKQPGQLRIVTDYIFVVVGAFSASQNRPGRVLRLGGDAADHSIDVRRIGAY